MFWVICMRIWKKRLHERLKHWPGFFVAAMLIWQPNLEPDLAGYKVYIGEKSRQYTAVFNVGKRTRYSLAELSPDKTYYLAVTAYDASGNESALSQEVVLQASAGGGATSPEPEGTLARTYNFPNPFRAGQQTTLRYYLSEPGRVTIKIYDVKGDLIKLVLDQAQRAAGENLGEAWDGTDLNGAQVSPGLYFAEVQARDKKTVVKVVVQP